MLTKNNDSELSFVERVLEKKVQNVLQVLSCHLNPEANVSMCSGQFNNVQVSMLKAMTTNAPYIGYVSLVEWSQEHENDDEILET